MKIYPGDSYPIKGTFKDHEGVLFDPDTHIVQLRDPSNEGIHSLSDPTRESEGTFNTSFDIPVTGKFGVWAIYWTVVKDGHVDTERHLFKVRPSQ